MDNAPHTWQRRSHGGWIVIDRFDVRDDSPWHIRQAYTRLTRDGLTEVRADAGLGTPCYYTLDYPDV